jgi:hypothetical protein
MITGTVVKCYCGYRFCFSCHREAHAPADCDQVCCCRCVSHAHTCIISFPLVID